MYRIATLCLFTFALAGCAALFQSAKVQTKFDYEEHRPYADQGTSTIKGQIFFKQPGGAFVTCAGREVVMMPATSYFREVADQVRAGRRAEGVEKLDPKFKSVIKSSRCNAEGNFEFSGIPSGRWWVGAVVAWSVGGNSQGGILAAEVGVSKGETVVVSLDGARPLP